MDNGLHYYQDNAALIDGPLQTLAICIPITQTHIFPIFFCIQTSVMESPILLFLIIFLFTIGKNAVVVEAEVDRFGLEQVVSEDFELPMGMSGDDEIQLDGNGRSLLWNKFKYYISYGALSANRIPCPPRSGRSYYTHHCYHATGPAHPYTRGCSAITRCRR